MNAEDLHRAARWGSLSEVKHMLHCKYFRIEDRGYSCQTPLHDAATGGFLAVVKCLMEEYEADAEARDDRDCTPLILAAKRGNLEVVKYLVEIQGVSVKAYNIFGATSLHVACSEWEMPVIKYLVNQQPLLINVPNHLGMTSLHLASKESHAGMLKVLLDGGADMRCKTNIGLTPLHVAATSPRGARTEVLQVLLQQEGVDPLAAAGQLRNTVLHLCKSKTTCQCILEHVAKYGLARKLLSIQNKRGFTPLQQTQQYAREELNSMLQDELTELVHYLESWEMRLAVPPASTTVAMGHSLPNLAFEQSVTRNPQLDKLQTLLADKIFQFLEHRLGGIDAIAVAILGYLTPLDVSMRWDQWNFNRQYYLTSSNSKCSHNIAHSVEYHC